MNCYLWELESILEGLALRDIDIQERQSIFAFNLRYVLNAKKTKTHKSFRQEKSGEKNQGSILKNKFLKRETSNGETSKNGNRLFQK